MAGFTTKGTADPPDDQSLSTVATSNVSKKVCRFGSCSERLTIIRAHQQKPESPMAQRQGKLLDSTFLYS